LVRRFDFPQNFDFKNSDLSQFWLVEKNKIINQDGNILHDTLMSIEKSFWKVIKTREHGPERTVSRAGTWTEGQDPPS